MPPLFWGSANSPRSGIDWSQTRARSPLKLLVSLGQSSASSNLRFRRCSLFSRIWTGGLPGYLTSQRIYNPIYLKTRISSLLEYILRGICSSHAVPWKNSRFRWLPYSLNSNWERGPLVGEYLFDEVLVSQAGDRLQGDVSLKSNIMLDTLAKRSQAPKDRTLPPPKRPAPASTPLVSVKKPKQNPQPTGRGRGKQGKGHFFSGQSAHRGKGRGAKGPGRPWRSDAGLHEGTGGAPITSTNFGPITRENSREAIKILGGLVRNRCRPLGYAHRTMGVQDPLCDAAPTEISGTGDHVPQGVTKVVIPEPISARAAEQGSDRASSALPGLLQPIVPCSQGNGGVEADHRSVLPQCLRALPELHYGDASVNPQGPSQGQWLTSLDLKDAYFHIGIHPADRRYLRFCHNGTSWQFTVLPFGLSTSPRVFTKILKPVLAYAHLHRVKLHMYLDDWLLNPGTRQEAHEQTSWLRSLCQKLGLVINLEKSDLIPSQVSTYLGIELDTSVGLARPSLKRLTNWLSVAEGFTAQQSPPAVQWLQVLGHLVSLEKLVPYGRIRIRPIQWHLRLQWNQSKERSSKLIPLDLQSRLAIPMVDQQGKFTKGSPSRDHRCGVLPVYRQQYSGLGCQIAGFNCIWHLVPGPGPTTHQCPGASSHMAWPKSFQPESGEYEGCAHVRQHVSGCLPEKSGGHQIARNERFSHGHMSVGREEGNDSSSPLSSRASECVSGPSVPEGSNPQDRVEPKPDCSRQDLSCLGRPFVDLFALGKNTKLAICVSPIREETSWKVDSLVQNWDDLYAYAYPPTSLIRACLNKVRTENVEIVLIAPVWPNQEWFPDLLDLSIDFPISLPPVQKLLKQTFSHHFHPHPWLLNLHAWRLSRDSTRREDFLKRLPKGSLYLRDNPQRSFTNLSGRCLESGAMLSRLILSRQLSNS